MSYRVHCVFGEEENICSWLNEIDVYRSPVLKIGVWSMHFELCFQISIYQTKPASCLLYEMICIIVFLLWMDVLIYICELQFFAALTFADENSFYFFQEFICIMLPEVLHISPVLM